MKRLMLTLFLLLAPVALGASQIEALRAGASAARSQVSSTRSAQMQGQAELNKLATRIEDLKAKQKGKLLPGSELDEALKRSQELSASLTATASNLSAQEAGLESANLALLTELSNELNRVRGDFDRQTDRNTRKALINKLRTLRAEREQVRAALPAAKLPALEAVRPSDDPEDLLEQADLLKDNEDKVRKQLQLVEKRLTEARAERDLDNRVRQFLGDEALFDESDRRLRVTKQETVQAAPGTNQPVGLNETADVSPGARFSAGEAQADHTFAPAAQAGVGNDPTNGFTSGTTGIQNTPPGSYGGAGGQRNTAPPADAKSGGGSFQRQVNGADARPNVGNRIAGGGDDEDDLEDLEIQRAKLKGLADELKVRATQLQKKAAQLK